MASNLGSLIGIYGVLFSCVAACTVDERPSSPFVSYDSAGVEIVDNLAPAWRGMDGWVIAPEPSVSIGDRAGDSQASFSLVGGAFRDGQGRILALDLQTRELRVFSLDGAFLYAAGGPGEGPGEFPLFPPQLPAPIYPLRLLIPWRGDSIAVVSPIGTLQVLDARGEEGWRMVDPELRRWPQAAWGGDRLLLTNSGAPPTGPEVEGWRYDTLLAMRMDGSIESVGVYPLEPVMGSGRGLAAPVRDGFITWKKNVPELRFHDWSGTLRRVVRLPIEPDLRPDSLQQRGSNASPVLSPILYVTTDHDGYLWMAGEQAAMRAPADALHVVSPDGQYLGRVELPSRFFPVDVGFDWILGIWRDDLDVEYLRVHALDRRGKR